MMSSSLCLDRSEQNRVYIPLPILGNIHVCWIDDTSAFVSLSQPEQVQIGEYHQTLKSRIHSWLFLLNIC